MLSRCFEMVGWGWIGMGFLGEALRMLTLPQPDEDKCLQDMTGPWTLEWAPIGEELEQALKTYFSGQGPLEYSGPVDLGDLTPFQEAAMRAMAKIPFGEVVSYRELALQAGHPGAARAVGQVCAGNPLPLVYPCHRVVASDGTLGGFGGGRSMKERLLALEGITLKEGRVLGR